MVICATADNAQPFALQCIRQHLRIVEHLLLIRFELGSQRLTQTNGLTGDHMHQWTTLLAGKDGAVDLFGILFATEDHTATRGAQCFVRGRSDNVAVRHWIRVQTSGHQTSHMRHIHHQLSADAVSNFAQPDKVKKARISASPGNQQLGLVLLGQTLHFIVIDALGFAVDAVMVKVVKLARAIQVKAMR